MEKCVSVIVPIYKVEPYLRRAVDSIINQSYSNLEIILVDDGSPDGCGKICDEYGAKDPRVKVVHKENGGLSDARNAGLDAAGGEYIAFVDSDDYIAGDYVETLLDVLEKNQGDVAMCSYAVTSSPEYDGSIFEAKHDADKERKTGQEKSGSRKKCSGNEESYRDGAVEVCNREELLKNLYDANHQDATYFIVAWNKLYKASLWEGIRFPKGKIHEDEATTYRIYHRAKKGVYLHKPLYGYFSAPESITRAQFNLKRLDWMDALDERIKFFEKEGEREQVLFAKRARADGAIHYYYPLKESLPAEKKQQKRLKAYVREELKEKNAKISFGGRLGYFIFLLSPGLYRILTCIDRDSKERKYQAAFLLLTAWLMFLCFYKLDVKYVDPWDESRHGVNAYEMLKEGNLIRSTYLYETDYYNLKPPLSMWTIMAGMIIFGKTVFAMRFPSAACYAALAVIVGSFVRKRYGRAPALCCLAFLSANTTPFLAHMVRAGDADSLYVLIFTMAMLCMLQIRENQKNLYGCGFLFALAFLTKSFHAGVIAVIGGLYLIFTGEIRKMKPVLWVKFIGSASVPVGIWGILRYLTDGGAFLKEMWYTDVVGRSKEGFGSNEAGFGYYFSYYLGKMSGGLQIYLLALLIIIAGGIFAVWHEKKKTKETIWAVCKKTVFHRDVIGFGLWILVPALAFSAVSTKLLWYQYPAVTALLIGAAVVAGRVLAGEAMPGAVRRIVLCASFACAGFYSLILAGTFRNYGINGAQTNEFQLLIQDTARDEETEGLPAYVVVETEQPENPYYDQWAQQDVFLAEAYGDYLCMQGGMEALLLELEGNEPKDDEGILFTTEGYYRAEAEALLNEKGMKAEVVGSRGGYVAVRWKG